MKRKNRAVLEKAGFDLLVSDLNSKSEATKNLILEKIAKNQYDRSRSNPNPRTKLIIDLRDAGFFDLAHKAMDGIYG